MLNLWTVICKYRFLTHQTLATQPSLSRVSSWHFPIRVWRYWSCPILPMTCPLCSICVSAVWQLLREDFLTRVLKIKYRLSPPVTTPASGLFSQHHLDTYVYYTSVCTPRLSYRRLRTISVSSPFASQHLRVPRTPPMPS